LERFNVCIGKWFGIPVYLDWSLFLFIGLFLLLSPMTAVVMIMAYAIVLLHEFGHALAGRHFNYPINKIVLSCFGGAAVGRIPRKPFEEFVVAIAGPLVNVALIPVLYLISHTTMQPVFMIFWQSVYYINFILIVFNLLPAYPMDGGRVLRAFLFHLTGDRTRATLYAVRTCWVVAGLVFVTAIWTGFWWASLILAVIASTAWREYLCVKAEEQALAAGSGTHTVLVQHSELTSEISTTERELARIQAAILEHERKYNR
jgi:Zn-dependent protease